MGLEIIAALTKTHIIGQNGKLPWNIPADMKHFKEITTGQAVIMGKNTWESLPEKFRPLPNRTNIVISKTLEKANGAIISKTLEEGIKEANKTGKRAIIIGGAQLYASAMPIANILHLSWVKKEYSGDTYFPKFNENEWNITDEKDCGDFIYKKYDRKRI
jgi:dihydrofolate reductase